MSTNRFTCRSVSASAARRAAFTVVPVTSLWPSRSMSPRLTNTKCGSSSSTMPIAASHGEHVGGVPGDRDDRLRLPAVGGAGAEDAVEVLLAEHRAGGPAAAVQLVDHRGRPDVGSAVHVADVAERAVVDRVRRHAAAVRPHPGHHHHVVRDGLHDRQRAGPRVVLAAVTQRLHGRHQAAADLVGPAAVEHQHVAALAARGHRRRGRRRGEPDRGTAGAEDLEEGTPPGARLLARSTRPPPARTSGTHRLVDGTQLLGAGVAGVGRRPGDAGVAGRRGRRSRTSPSAPAPG